MTSGKPERCRLALSFHPGRALIAAMAVIGGVSLYGCGDGGSDEVADSATPPPSAVTPPPSAQTSVPTSAANRAPTIFGRPPGSITGGTSYTFLPTASDADGDPLTFAIVGRPAWAMFDSSTGRLSGTPTQNDVGTSSPVAISVSDGEATVALGAFTINVVGTATGSASLVWVPPTENEDGTPLLDLAGYKLYWGTEEGSYPNSVTLMNPGITRYVVEDLTPAEWHFVMTAVNSRGIESELSNLTIEEVL
jgi:hypothetical protein